MSTHAWPASFIVALVDRRGDAIGGGVLLGDSDVITCAHVVNAALGRPLRSQDRPTEPVSVRFPLTDGSLATSVLRAVVTGWLPPAEQGTDGPDLARLRLTESPVPYGARPGQLVDDEPAPGVSARIYGFPQVPRRPGGAWAGVTISGVVSGRRIQMDWADGSALRVQPGYSGSPLCLKDSHLVAGLVVAAPSGASAERDSYAIHAGQIRSAFPDLATSTEAVARPGTSSPRELTVLHLSDTQFGHNNMFGGNGGTAAAPLDYETLIAQLKDDLDGLRDGHGLSPDLIVVTGDLAEMGKPSELRQAMDFIGRIAAATAVPREHVAIVPGNHDINWWSCRGYFEKQAAAELAPARPYRDKWEPFAQAFNDFYATVGLTFDLDEPWTLFEMPELRVVIAGLNSTMAESHQPEDHYGQVTDAQLRWFADRLHSHRRAGWLRLAAVHHNAVRGAVNDDENLRDVRSLDRFLGAHQLINLLLHGHTHDGQLHRLSSGLPVLSTGSAAVVAEARPQEVPNQYQMVVLRADGFTRYARHYAVNQTRWIGDPRISSSGDNWIDTQHHLFADCAETFQERAPVAPPAGPPMALRVPAQRVPAEDGALQQVMEALRAKHPSAHLSERAEEGYIRVSQPLPEQSGSVVWPVGVIDGDVDATALNRFVTDVHSRFRFNPHTPSELVYTGQLADRRLVEQARQQGIRLTGLTDFQGLIELTALVDEQTERLNNDVVHPPEHYLSQRFRYLVPTDGVTHDDLARRITAWLRASSARLIIVLGDAGRGKTSLMHHLARTLPTEMPDVAPILVELRNLTKSTAVDDLVGQYFMNHDVEGISARKVRYMITSGRLALLFDGFDELESRIGYGQAEEYLQLLLDSVTDDAKLVLTSRTEHFLSTSALLNAALSKPRITALGNTVMSRPDSRIVVLEGYSTEQIRAYLVRRYQGDAEQAQRRFELLDNIPKLMELAQNPRMLAFIADLRHEDLAAVRESQALSAAGLYRELIERWLGQDEHRPNSFGPVISTDQRRRACYSLAEQAWASGRPSIGMEQISAEAANILQAMATPSAEVEQATYQIGARSLFVRDDAGEFSFVHESIMEWLVAHGAAQTLDSGGRPHIFSVRQATDLMIGFFVDLAGSTVASRWATTTLEDRDAPEAAKQNALSINQRLGLPTRQTEPGPDLTRMDLRGQDLTSHDLHNANLRGATLRGMRLIQLDLSGAQLDGADFRSVRFMDGSLRDADFGHSRWDMAAILGDVGVDPERTPALNAAAMSSRDPAVAQIAAGGPPAAITTSPDGRLLAVARLHAVEIVDSASAQTLRILTGHRGYVHCVAFSPSGNRLATASEDGTARIWDIHAGEAVSVLAEHGGPVTSVAFSPDGKVLLTGCYDSRARLWDLQTGRIMLNLADHTRPITAVAFAPNGSYVATASLDNTTRIFGVQSGTTHQHLIGHHGPVTTVEFSPDGRHLATGSQDCTIRMWDTETWRTRFIIFGHTAAISGLTFDPQSRRIATASYDRTVQVWDTATGRSQPYPGTQLDHRGPVYAITHTPDGKALISASGDQYVRMWDLPSGQVRVLGTGQTGTQSCVSFTPDGSSLLTTSLEGSCRVWDIATGTLRDSRRLRSRGAAAAFSPSGDHLAYATSRRVVEVVKAADGERTQRVDLSTTQADRPASALLYSPDGRWIAAATGSSVSLLPAEEDSAGPVYLPHTSPVTALAFSADGRFLATAYDDRSVRIWNMATHRTSRVIADAHPKPVSAVALSFDGSRLATASYEGYVRLWDQAHPMPTREFTEHVGPVTAIAFSQDDRLLATASQDTTGRVWDSASGRWTVLAGHTGVVNGIAFSPDLRLVATVSSDRTARIWCARTGTEQAALIGLGDDDYAVLLPDGRYKLDGDARDVLWWSMKLCRFEPGELDDYLPAVTRLDSNVPITGGSQ